MNAPPLVDPERLRALRDDYGDVAAQVVELFERSARSTLDELRAAQERGDADEVARLAHRLKGGARNAGATAMGAVCAELEAAPADAGALDRLAGTVEPTIAALRELL